MPTYDYTCARCGTMEEFQSIKAEPLTVCPRCGSRRFRREISAGAGIIFKGSGFYVTDYERKNSGSDSKPADKSEAAKADSPAKPGNAPAPATEAKSEEAPAPKTAAKPDKAAAA